MTQAKVLKVIKIYRRRLKKFANVAWPKNFVFPRDKKVHPGNIHDRQKLLFHCYKMLDQMEVFVKEGRMDKTFRWLGFIQGCVCAFGIYSINQMKNHNRPDLRKKPQQAKKVIKKSQRSSIKKSPK